MVGSALGSGPFGEYVAIDWLQLIADLPMALSIIGFLFAMIKRVTGQIDDHAVGVAGLVMVGASGFAATIYLIGFACIYAGLMWEGAFPHRLSDNLLGSVLFFFLGLAVYLFPKQLDRLDQWLSRRKPRA